MHIEVTLLALVVGSLALTWVCRRFDVSAPLVLVVAGIAASFLPGVELVEFDPNIVMLLVLTPLLYSAALESSYMGIKANRRPIGLLAVGLVAFSTFGVGLVAWWLVPGLSLATALVLGAVVAPPDAVSALAVGRRLGLPRRVMTILGGESLVNDATALTLFRVFLAAAAGAGTTVLGATGMFLLAAVGGTAIGYAVGWLVHHVRRRLHDPTIEAALGLVVPFVVYVLAEQAHTSGVLAVVVAGLYLGHHAPQSGYATRLQEAAVWRASDSILESIVFALIGLQLTSVVAEVGEIGPLIVSGIVVTAAVVLARIVWVFPATYLPRALFRGVRKRDPMPSWHVPAVISWSGMRGVVTLAAAFAIPPELPYRDEIVFLAFFVTVATLLLHGLTLPTVIRKLGVRENGFQEDMLAEAQTQYDAVQASIARLDELTAETGSATAHTAEKLRRFAQLNANAVWEQLGRSDEEAGESPGAAYRRLRREMLTEERELFVDRRNSGAIDDEVLRRVLRRLDFEEAMLARDEAN
ncbi:Na+/H+ antiporter [Pseudonocardia sp. TRM90224]|uniref:Na+/H+ antiporter n=1 Tax=Pseudonocardia sp. TRM90224 TaxID=2812678 RepID=UPI001E43D867|nr:Na+/H+ antiporter [Pseudonocardia sp. TRM90224]